MLSASSEVTDCTCNTGSEGPAGGPCGPLTSHCSPGVATVTYSGTCPCAGPSTGSLSGTISSAYPSPYPGDADCQWLITTNVLISLSFSKFYMETNYDFVNIFLCTSPSNCADQIAHLTGNNPPQSVYTSNTGYMLVQLTSDSSVNWLGIVSAWSTPCSASCNTGYTGLDGGTCAACSAGTYMCSMCAAGTYKDTTDSAACTACTVGKYSKWSGSQSCTPCGAGKYSSTSGATACVACAAGMFADEGASACRTCTTVTFARAGACVACAAGTYSTTAASTCLVCHANSTIRAAPRPRAACATRGTSPGRSICIWCTRLTCVSTYFFIYFHYKSHGPTQLCACSVCSCC